MIDDWKLVICYWEDEDRIGTGDSNDQFSSCVGQDSLSPEYQQSEFRRTESGPDKKILDYHRALSSRYAEL